MDAGMDGQTLLLCQVFQKGHPGLTDRGNLKSFTKVHTKSENVILPMKSW